MPSPAAVLLQTALREAQSCVGKCQDNWKIGFAVLLFAEAVVFGLIIYALKRYTSSSSGKFSYIFHLGHALSGGVFFSAGVLHILPEAIALINGEHGEEGHGEEEHAEEERRWLTLRQEEEDEHDEDGHDEDEHHDEESHDEESHSEGFPWAFLILMLSFYALFFLEKIALPKLLAPKSVKTDEETGQLTPDSTADKEESDMPVETKGFKSPEFITGLVEILGISAHSLFESIALGLSGSFTTVLNIFIATAAHRWATASALGFKLLKSLNFLPFLVLLLLFSAIAPIGIGIGAALGNLSQAVQGVLFSISAGTFIYIGVYEVMAEEFAVHQKWHMTKFLMTMLGASIIIVVTVILNVLDIHG